MLALIGSLASALGLASGVILFLIALVQGLMRAPDLITPTRLPDRAAAAQPARAGEFEPDLAWPFYPFRQARADLARVGADLGVAGTGSSRSGRWTRSSAAGTAAASGGGCSSRSRWSRSAGWSRRA